MFCMLLVRPMRRNHKKTATSSCFFVFGTLGESGEVSLGQAPRLSFRAHVVRLVSGEPVNRVPRPGRDIDFPKGSNQGLAPSSVHARMASPVTGDSVHGIPPHFLRRSIS